jgi:hypothetical protein
MQKPSSLVLKLLHQAVLDLEKSPGLTEEETRWLQEFDSHLIAQSAVIWQPPEPSLPKFTSF